MRRVNEDGAWSGWTPGWGGTVKQISAMMGRRGEAHIVAIGTDDLVHDQVVDRDGRWSGWSPGF
jgi:hypothetical protein